MLVIKLGFASVISNSLQVIYKKLEEVNFQPEVCDKYDPIIKLLNRQLITQLLYQLPCSTSKYDKALVIGYFNKEGNWYRIVGCQEDFSESHLWVEEFTNDDYGNWWENNLYYLHDIPSEIIRSDYQPEFDVALANPFDAFRKMVGGNDNNLLTP